jgi:hypothetical protein
VLAGGPAPFRSRSGTRMPPPRGRVGSRRGPLSFRTAAFPGYGLEGWHFSRCLPNPLPSLSLIPAYAGHRLLCVSSDLRPSRGPHGPALRRVWRPAITALEVGYPPPQGPRSGLNCSVPVRRHCIRPRPPRLQAHRDFAVWRLYAMGAGGMMSAPVRRGHHTDGLARSPPCIACEQQKIEPPATRLSLSSWLG